MSGSPLSQLKTLIEEADRETLLAVIVLALARLTTPSSEPKPSGNGRSDPPIDAEHDALVTYKEGAEFFRCSVSHIETLVRQGKIPCVRLPAADRGGRSRGGRLVRLRIADLRALADQHRA
jgi:hypothetical protein